MQVFSTLQDVSWLVNKYYKILFQVLWSYRYCNIIIVIAIIVIVIIVLLLSLLLLSLLLLSLLLLSLLLLSLLSYTYININFNKIQLYSHNYISATEDVITVDDVDSINCCFIILS